jgi:hypothetical protein
LMALYKTAATATITTTRSVAEKSHELTA